MRYLNARDVLPDALVEELQRYLQGAYVYVPAPEGTKKGWGENSGYRLELLRRNEAIIAERRSGMSIEALAERYSLSESAIRKILYRR